MKIPPTVGRVVWFYEDGEHYASKQPYAGMIAFVHSNDCVNVKYVDADTGASGYARSCPLVHEVSDETVPATGYFCTWMPYQLGQAAKTEAVERQLADVGTTGPKDPPL